MQEFNLEYIRNMVADSNIIFERGKRIYDHGTFLCHNQDIQAKSFKYEVDGSYGDYDVYLDLSPKGINFSCDCPYPGQGCKHVVAVMLDALDKLAYRDLSEPGQLSVEEEQPEALTAEEIREKALEDRHKRARSERLKLIQGEMYKGEHILETEKGRQYVVVVFDPQTNQGHCTCPDFNTNQLGTCKHLIFLCEELKKQKGFSQKVKKERFPFVDIYWDSVQSKPGLFYERTPEELGDLYSLIQVYFDEQGFFAQEDLGQFMTFLKSVSGYKQVRVRDEVLGRVENFFLDREIESMSKQELPELTGIKAQLYPYQEEGVRYCLYRKSALIGDEMGLGKTLQAIVLAILKKNIFGFQRILVITLASLKEQWKREISKFTSEQAIVVAGNARQRQQIYEADQSLFKITNYEAVLRDFTQIKRFKPDLIILDEAQRIKNFATKTADTVKGLPRKHALVLTGTPLENRLEDVYSIVQFLDPFMLAPLWRFSADHFLLSRKKKDKILGYHNLNLLHQKLGSLVIRRRKSEVLSELPDEITNNYYLELTHEQAKIHAGYMQSLLPILNKKFMTPMDIRRIQELLLKMRSVCDSTYLIDRKTNISPKLKELEGILDELVVQSRRKMVIFSEWTTMTYLIAKQLSKMNIPFVELTGKIPVHKRQALIDEFTHNPECLVFLSTDSGGTGLNLQAADCVLNFELPWNPARLNQRIGRVNRIGQTSGSINVINLVSKDSIEEKILAGIHLKSELFSGVFDGTVDMVDFSSKKRNQMLNELRSMMDEELQEDQREIESRTAEELSEDTPYFLNPQALAQEEGAQEEVAQEEGAREEENEQGQEEGSVFISEQDTSAVEAEKADAEARDQQSPAQMEQVLNSGMEFISGLLEMATGKKLTKTDDQEQMIKLDPQTGEVTMKFKLPGI